MAHSQNDAVFILFLILPVTASIQLRSSDHAKCEGVSVKVYRLSLGSRESCSWVLGSSAMIMGSVYQVPVSTWIVLTVQGIFQPPVNMGGVQGL